ncbi:hypothetical protein BegalDRAFT_2394 [Beggiatoa alba B18LD]|uniref:DUF2281 domain-containing protein n=1 Tax=Beggiatoa alba B18LD TaxID=395493 RepID=I3CI02_9GAMM|nr:hypothetical protein [Beggiatoa alba]EIJ43245.1 hypothetical protein BegalDRAFT_2394 [Beggiatoa alba B18LD]
MGKFAIPDIQLTLHVDKNGILKLQHQLPEYMAEQDVEVVITVHAKPIEHAPKARPLGLLKGQFQVPATFFEPLPSEILDAFEGK